MHAIMLQGWKCLGSPSVANSDWLCGAVWHDIHYLITSWMSSRSSWERNPHSKEKEGCVQAGEDDYGQSGRKEGRNNRRKRKMFGGGEDKHSSTRLWFFQYHSVIFLFSKKNIYFSLITNNGKACIMTACCINHHHLYRVGGSSDKLYDLNLATCPNCPLPGNTKVGQWPCFTHWGSWGKHGSLSLCSTGNI